MKSQEILDGLIDKKEKYISYLHKREEDKERLERQQYIDLLNYCIDLFNIKHPDIDIDVNINAALKEDIITFKVKQFTFGYAARIWIDKLSFPVYDEYGDHEGYSESKYYICSSVTSNRINLQSNNVEKNKFVTDVMIYIVNLMYKDKAE